MPKPALSRRDAPNKAVAFDAQAFLDSAGVSRKVVEYPKKAAIFSQGDPALNVLYIQRGAVKLSVVNTAGKEAGPGRPQSW